MREGEQLTPNGNYVYAAVNEGEVVYIGKGKGKRWQHCTSGISSNYHLNRLHFDGANVEVRIVHDNLSSDCCEALEAYLIAYHRPAGNSVGKYGDSTDFAKHLCANGIDYTKHHNIVKGFHFT
jgi:hypothetical protein